MQTQTRAHWTDHFPDWFHPPVGSEEWLKVKLRKLIIQARVFHEQTLEGQEALVTIPSVLELSRMLCCSQLMILKTLNDLMTEGYHYRLLSIDEAIQLEPVMN